MVAGAIWITHTPASTQDPLQGTVMDDGSVLGLTASLCSRHVSVR